MKMIPKPEARSIIVDQTELPDPVIETIRTMVLHRKSLHIIVGLFPTPTAKEEGLKPIRKMEFFFTDTKLPKWVDGEGRMVTISEQGQHYYIAPAGDRENVPEDEIQNLTMVYTGQGDAEDVLSKITVGFGYITVNDPAARQWVLEQTDWFGEPFGLNWEIVD